MISRRSLLGTGAAALVGSLPARADDPPRFYLDSAVATANTIASTFGQTGDLTIRDLTNHYMSTSNLFLYMANAGINDSVPAMVQQAFQEDASLPQKLKDQLDTLSSSMGISYHQGLLNRVYTPTSDEVIAAIGSNFGLLQQTFANGLSDVIQSNPSHASYHPPSSFLERHKSLSAALSRNSSVRLHEVEDSGGLGPFITAAGNITTAGLGISGLAAGISIFGAGTAVAASATALFIIGGGLVFAGVALTFYGAYLALQSMRTTGGPPTSGHKPTPL